MPLFERSTWNKIKAAQGQPLNRHGLYFYDSFSKKLFPMQGGLTLILKNKGLTPRQLQSQKTRNKIFKTALSLFAKYSYESVTVDDIVKHSSVSKGSFYTYFKSKDHIMLEQFQQLDGSYEQWFQTFSPDRSASAQLLSFIKNLAVFVNGELHLEILKVVYTSQISLSSAVPKLLSDETRPYYKIIWQIVELGVKQEEFRNDTPIEELTRLISRSVRGLLYDWCLFEGSFDLEEESQKYFTLILDMLKKRND